MSLSSLVNSKHEFENVDPGYISESAMNQLCESIAMDTLNPEEIETYVSESAEMGIVTEAQRNIVKLNKQAQMNRAYKTAVLQLGAEDGDREYKKLRTLWKLEAKLFRKLEAKKKNKAMARAREAMKNLKKRKSMGAVAGQRAEKAMNGAKTLLQSGPVKLGAKK